jgi:GNAT superfamily N-acetyltransferase
VITVRDATPTDNAALVDLSVACPMEGDIGLAVDRAPDFFALNRMEGDTWRVGVVDGPEGTPIGCIALAGRHVYLNGDPTPGMYVSDLKVHPAHRGGGVADALTAWARDACVAALGPRGLVFLTILAGNEGMARRMDGPRGLPHMERVATYRTHTIPLLARRRRPDVGVGVRRAGPADLADMASLWARLAPGHQLATVHDPATFAAWIEAAPDLALSDYRVARRTDAEGELVGFMGLWDQSAIKRLRVTGYSRKLGAVRRVFNALGPLVGGTKLPPPGGALRNLTAVQVCVPPEDPGVLRALVVDAYNDSRRWGFSFLNVGLDAADPLAAGLKGLLAQPTDIWVCVAFLEEPPPGLVGDGRPTHHEIALV